MTKTLKENIKDYYGGYNLSTRQLRQMQNIQTRLRASYYRRLKYRGAWATVASVAILLVFLFIFFNTTSRRAYFTELITEIANNHNKNLDVEIKSNSLEDVGRYLSRLGFPLIDSARIPRDAWELIGGRYCFLKGQFAAQLKLQNKMDRKIYTLYQLEKPTDITGVSGFSENYVNGVKVNLWIERGLVIALAGES